jgi:hypothetical protein
MKSDKFLRCYEIIVRTSQTEAFRIKQGIEDGIFREGLRITFNSTKSIFKGLNEATISIYNLEPNKRDKVIKFFEEEMMYFQVVIRAGYPDKIGGLFQGNILTAYTQKEGTDFVTQLECLDGLYDKQNAFISTTVKSDDKVVIDEILKTTKYTKLGGVTLEKNERVRGKTLVGASYDVLEKIAFEKNKLFYIDDDRAFLLNENEVVSDNAILISGENSILQTPTRKNNIVNVKILLEPALRLGGLIELNSSVKRLNGYYRVDTIQTNFDSHGGDCSQDLELRLINNYKKVAND